MTSTASYTSTTLIDELTAERSRRLTIQSAAEELLRLIDRPMEYVTVERLRGTSTVSRLRAAIKAGG